MDADFWHQKWEKKEIRFHEGRANPQLVENFKELSLVKESRVFVPLCGKTLDIAWLLSRGYRVVGAELSQIAIQELFEELGEAPIISTMGNVKHYSANRIDVFVGDIFALSGKMLGSIDAIYDRAALVALPEEMRKRYTAHLIEITNQASQLLISYAFDQGDAKGPPFSVSNAEVNQHYGNHYELTLLASTDVPRELEKAGTEKENVWLLRKK